MKTRTIAIKGKYDQDKETTIRVTTGKLLSPTITKRTYKAAVKRMGLIEGDYPVLAENFPAIAVVDNFGEGYALIQ